MKTMQVTFLLSIVCLLGCTSTHRLRSAHEEDYVSLNNRAVWQHALVTLVDDHKIRVENLRMTSDSTYWMDRQMKQQTSPTYIAGATSQIKEVRLIRRGRGAVDGIGLGLTGALIGAPIGALIAHRDVYVVEHEAQIQVLTNALGRIIV